MHGSRLPLNHWEVDNNGNHVVKSYKNQHAGTQQRHHHVPAFHFDADGYINPMPRINDHRLYSWWQNELQRCIRDAGRHAVRRNYWVQMAGNYLLVFIQRRLNLGDIFMKYSAHFQNLDKYYLTGEDINTEVILGLHLGGDQGLQHPQTEVYIHKIGNHMLQQRIRII